MCLADVDLLLDYWSEHPPPEDLIAAYLGFKPATPKPTTTTLGEPESKAGEMTVGELRLAAIKHIKGGTKERGSMVIRA
jgi:hypothetical protein